MTTRRSGAGRVRVGAGAIGAAAVLLLAISGCASPTVSGGGSGPGGSGAGGSGPGGSSTTAPIDGEWTLVTGSDAKGTFTPGTATVTLDLNGARSGGKGPCNAFGARTSASTTGPIAIILGIRTEMACADPERNATEARYFAALGLVRTAAIAGGRLSLTGGGDTLVFVRSTT